MVQKAKNRIITEEDIRKLSEPTVYSFLYPGQAMEYTFVPIRTENEKLENRDLKSKRKLLLSKGYKEMDDPTEIEQIVGPGNEIFINNVLDGTMLFFIWKYSNLLKIHDSKEDREIFLSEMEELEAINITKKIKESNSLKKSYLWDVNGKLELCTNGKMARLKANGKPLWQQPKRDEKPYIVTRKADVFDFSLDMMQKAIKELGINYSVEVAKQRRLDRENNIIKEKQQKLEKEKKEAERLLQKQKEDEEIRAEYLKMKKEKEKLEKENAKLKKASVAKPSAKPSAKK